VTSVDATQLLAGFPDLQQRGDPAGARVIDVVSAKVPGSAAGRPRSELLPAVLMELAKDVTSSDIIPEVRDFLCDGDAIDALLVSNHERVKRAQKFFGDNGVVVITALFHASLPEAYLGKRGVQVLDITGELWRSFTRRAQETGQFLINVLSPTPSLWRDNKTTSLTSGQFAAIACRRVRLVHAAVRWMVTDVARHDLPPPSSQSQQTTLTVWNERMREIGEGVDTSAPLNQEDLLATLGTFTTVVFDVLDRFAVSYDDVIREDFYFLWNVIGWHLGIGDAEAVQANAAAVTSLPSRFPDNRILPLSGDELDAVYKHLAAKLQKPTHQGTRMTKALMQELAYPLPERLQGAPAFIARYLLSEKHADDLGIEKGGYTELLLNSSGLLRRWSRLARLNTVSSLGIALVSRQVSEYAVRVFISQARWSERGLKIDPQVASRWGIELPPKRSVPPPI